MITLIILFTLFVIVIVYFFIKLNQYISLLEKKIRQTNDVVENLKQSFREVLINDSFLLDDGKIKKTPLQKENISIVNGISVTEQNLEI